MPRLARYAKAALACVVSAMLFTPSGAGAVPGSDAWVAHGPPGGSVDALAIGAGAPDRVWSGTVYGQHTEPKPGQASVSDNGGRTWHEVPDLRLEPIGVLAVDPTNADVVYAGADCNACPGLFKTTDGGRHWVLTTLYRRFVRAIAIDPSNPQNVYAGTLMDGALKSVDGGDTWAPINMGLDGQPVFALAVDPFDSQTLLAGTQNHGVYRSTDGGAHWSPASDGIGQQKVGALVPDPTAPGHLYSGTAGGVYRTVDGGITWTPASEGLDGHGVGDLVMAAGDPRRMYAGSAGNGGWRTNDGGRTWVQFGTPLSGGGVLALAVDPTDDNVVYAGTAHGVMKSGDGGRTWELRTRGLSNSDVWGLAIGGTGTGVLYAGEQNQLGILRSRDGGETWHTAAGGLPSNAFVRSIAVDPADTETAYASMSQGVYRTVDGGRHWDRLRASPTPLSEMVRVAPSDPSRIYADGFVSGHGRHLYRSEDGGTTWQDISGSVVGDYNLDVAVDAADADHIYATTGASVYESHDGGDGWSSVSNGLPTGVKLAYLAIDRFDPSLLYTTVFGHDLYRTSDGGGHWVLVDTTACGTTLSGHPATDPSQAGVVYVTTYSGVCRGVRGGRMWTRLPDLARYLFALNVVVSPDGGAVYVATLGAGVVRYSPG